MSVVMVSLGCDIIGVVCAEKRGGHDIAVIYLLYPYKASINNEQQSKPRSAQQPIPQRACCTLKAALIANNPAKTTSNTTVNRVGHFHLFWGFKKDIF